MQKKEIYKDIRLEKMQAIANIRLKKLQSIFAKNKERRYIYE